MLLYIDFSHTILTIVVLGLLSTPFFTLPSVLKINNISTEAHFPLEIRLCSRASQKTQKHYSV